jgi:hypothetical protein
MDSSLRGALALLVALACLGQARTSEAYEEPGGYLILGGLTGFQVFQNLNGQPFDHSLGFEIRAGYRMNPFLAFEVEGDFLSGFNTRFDIPPGTPGAPPGGIPNAALTIDGGNIGVNVKGHVPGLGRLQPYGLFGIAGQWNRLRSTYTVGTICSPGYWGWWCQGAYAQIGTQGAFIMKFGAGTDLWITEDWALTVDAAYVLPVGKLSNLTYVSMGWGVKFKF